MYRIVLLVTLMVAVYGDPAPEVGPDVSLYEGEMYSITCHRPDINSVIQFLKYKSMVLFNGTEVFSSNNQEPYRLANNEQVLKPFSRDYRFGISEVTPLNFTFFISIAKWQDSGVYGCHTFDKDTAEVDYIYKEFVFIQGTIRDVTMVDLRDYRGSHPTEKSPPVISGKDGSIDLTAGKDTLKFACSVNTTNSEPRFTDVRRNGVSIIQNVTFEAKYVNYFFGEKLLSFSPQSYAILYYTTVVKATADEHNAVYSCFAQHGGQSFSRTIILDVQHAPQNITCTDYRTMADNGVVNQVISCYQRANPKASAKWKSNCEDLDLLNEEDYFAYSQGEDYYSTYNLMIQNVTDRHYECQYEFISENDIGLTTESNIYIYRNATFDSANLQAPSIFLLIMLLLFTMSS